MNELKKHVLECGLDKVQARISKQKYIAYLEKDDALFERTLGEESIFLQEAIRPMWQEAERLNKAKYERVKRLKNRIAHMLASECVFITLTFSDAKIDLNETKRETRRKYVQRFLNDLKANYVANIDFGEKNGREHYHALVQLSAIDCHKWIYGAMNVQRVRSERESTDIKLAKYIAKLTNHAIKESVQNNRIMYSRLDYSLQV